MTRTIATALAGGALLLLALTPRLRAKKTAPERLKVAAGASWSLEDTVSARIPDPQTGGALTPATRGVFHYSVERLLPDGSAVLSVSVVSLAGGISEKSLKPLPVDHPPRPEQLALLTPEGRIYGPYADETRKSGLRAAQSADAWLASKPQAPWVWYKFPADLAVGASITQSYGKESWEIERRSDEKIGGSACAVYEATLQNSKPAVREIVWLDESAGAVVKREVSERRAKSASSTLTQVRL